MAQIPQNTNYSTDTASGMTPSSSTLPGIMKAIKMNKLGGVSFNPVAQYQTDKKSYPDQGFIETPPATYKPMAAPTTEKVQPIPADYKSFVGNAPSTFSQAPTPTTVARNWPADLGGGQYALDTAAPGSLIKSNRMDTFAEKEAERGSLSSKSVQIDHIIPLWAGGTDTASNKQLISIADNYRKQQAHSIPIALLTAGKIDLAQAKLMAYEYQNLGKDVISQMPDLKEGKLSLADAEKYQKRFDQIIADPKPVTFKSVMSEVPAELSNFFGAKGPIAKVANKLGIGSQYTEGLRRYGKGFIEGTTFGYLDTPSASETPSAGWEGDVQNKVVLPMLEFLGKTTGQIVAFKPLLKGLGLAKSALANTPLAKYSKDAVTGFTESTPWAQKALQAADKVTSLGFKKADKILGGKAGEIAAGLRIPVEANTSEAAIRLKNIASTGLDFALIGQLNKRQENDFQSRITSFITDASMGGIMAGSGQGLGAYTRMMSGLTTIGIMGNVIAGDQNPVANAFQNALVLTAFHSLGNPQAQKLGLNEGGSLIEDLGGKDPVKGFFSSLRKGKAPTENTVENFRILIDNEANKISTAFLKEIAPKSIGEVDPKTGVKTDLKPEQIASIKQEAIANIQDQILQKKLTKSQSDLAIQQTYTALHQLEKGGLGVAIRNKVEKADIESIVKGLADGKNTKAIGSTIPDKMQEMYGSSDPMYKVKTAPSDVPPPTGDFPTGRYAMTGSGTDIKQGEYARNVQLYEDALKKGLAPDPDHLYIKRLPATEAALVTNARNAADPLILAGIKPRYQPNETVEVFGLMKDPYGKETFVQIGFVATEHRIAGPRDLLPGETLDTKTKEIYDAAKAYYFNHPANRRMYEPYDPSNNNSTLSKMMEDMGVDFMPVDYIMQKAGKGPFTTEAGQKHATLNITDQNIQDRLMHEKIYQDAHTTQPLPSQEVVKAPELSPTEAVKDINSVAPTKAPGTPVLPSTSPVEAPKPLETSKVSSQEKTPLKLAQTEVIKPEVSTLAKTISEHAQKRVVKPSAKDTPDRLGAREKYSSLLKQASDIVKGATSEGRPLTKEENTAVTKLDKESTDILKKYKAVTLNVKAQTQEVSSKLRDTYTKTMDIEAKSAIEDYKPRKEGLSIKTLSEAYKKASDSVIPTKPKDMTEKDYQSMVKQHREKFDAYADDAAKETLGTEQFNEAEGAMPVTTIRTDASGKEITNITYPEGEKKNTDVLDFAPMGEQIKEKSIKQFAKEINDTFGVKLNKDGYIEVDKAGNPLFETKNKKEALPKFVLDEIKANAKMQTVYSNDLSSSIKKMRASESEYGKSFADTLHKGLTEIFGENYNNNYSLNSMMNPTKPYGFLPRLFSSVNQLGHTLSQPQKYIKAQLGGNKAEVGKVIEDVTQQRTTEAIDRENSLIEDTISKEVQDMIDRGGHVKSAGQEENMVHDIIKLENLMPGILKGEIGAGKENQADGARDAIRVLVTMSKDYNLGRKSKGKPGVFFDQSKIK